ncbi:flavin-containing monooxygenase [Tsukamurella ocularis]|uniref:flavin-containing monooxygenase n=1 Tax=Tsukamurella ocularis TaxID=1970234 RepID=UPI0021697204|nr:NAD(P)/FAD-dependent oxidoreductase [Tsukamurella ocularis]MCS3778822.1 cation diffusion facilitator CzcD-associated flavoprotein CzcO [Tsukamurella ocularis]MCS3787558.1 cation diffusion facilitator CzcD-associated flavoprotein CzcO [Tsukamurella ocularis]MCS3851505.1 cation diffusion facilitator CzcD-associated flavoprotein CzcO [Tsukamurella ocularis]
MVDDSSEWPQPDYEVVVIGAGAGGICAGIKLQEIGIHDFVLVDRAPAMGGTWRANTYPNVGADLPFLAYQFSFAPKADWSHFFAKGGEIQEYHVGLARDAGLDRKVRLNTTIVREEWDEAAHLWRLHIDDGSQITGRFVISAVGAYINPKDKPDIPGLEDFEGKVMIPSDWDDEFDYSGIRAAMIGVGSSAVQIAPALAERAAHLDIYQRTPQWYFPKPDFRNPRWLQQLLRVPGLAGLLHGSALAFVDVALRVLIYTPGRLFGFGARRFDHGAHSLYDLWMWICVRDKETRRKLRPAYGAGCTRGTLGGGYLAVFNRRNVELHTTSIARIERDAIVTADGVRHPADLLVLATGYEMFSDPESYREGAVVGADGFDLGVYYNDEGLRAYHSTSVAGLPNRWLMVGPYSWTGTAFHYILENAIRHISSVLAEARTRGATKVEVRIGAQEAFHKDMVTKGANLNHYFNVHCAGSNTYFVNSQKQAVYVRPWTLLQSYRRSTGFDRDDYRYESITTAQTQAAAVAAPGTVA